MQPCRAALLLALTLFTATVDAQTTPEPPADQASEQPFPRFATHVGKLDSDGFPIGGARLCLMPEQTTCYTMPSQPIPGEGKGTYDFGLDPRSDKHAIRSGGSWTLFAATFNAGGSGSLTRFALLRLTPQHTLQNLLPHIALVDAGEAALWDVPGQPYPLLVTTEPIWDMEHGETHFEPHHQAIQAFRYDPQAQRYVVTLRYRTTRKYSSDDGDPSPQPPLSAERAHILARLKAGS